jgi:hypothetical protein
MAGNVAGMFQQLNNAINSGGQAERGQGYIDSMSQGFGNVAAGVGNMMQPNRTEDVDPYSFMNEGAREREADKQMANIDMTTASGMKEASQLFLKKGDPVKAQQMAIAYQKKTDADAATLEQGQQEIQKGSARTKAMQLAMQRKDSTAHKALAGNFYSPEEYIAHVMDAEEPEPPKPFTLGTNDIRFDAEGNEIARGPVALKDEKGSSVPVYVERAAFDSAMAAREAAVAVGQAEQLVGQIDKAIEDGAGPAGGALATGEEAFRKFMGSPDAVSNLKIKYYRLRNSDAVANLPPGSASDADVQLALQGWPGDNAPLSQIRSFLVGMQKMQQSKLEFQRFTTDYIGDNRTTLGVSRAWREAQVEQSSNNIDFSAMPDS